MTLLHYLSIFILSLLQRHAVAFIPSHATTTRSSATLQMGFFDNLLKNAFANEKYTAPPEGIKATARHILVKSPEDVDMIMDQLQQGTLKFTDAARQFSTCPSSSQGGSLGSFPPGRMVPEFDAVIFDPQTSLGEVVGPVQTKFGYHLIVVDKRTGV
ncbi:hypothetical protein FisN_19Lu291 [Fistulifera solaris]|uniref:Peptidyl-prolyl cis-trans isomerase n=1 Tax=Fistulifera solaris TaxID=1519565 RepID=A0A1Z5K7V3_FISSO|nr:hypothetical protein FisN_19Lu291 [Fistulifera solaris]|eukprot:GAX22222.1 hypothetical protein FisN_19Lu291 [Fistulifera solaris]